MDIEKASSIVNAKFRYKTDPEQYSWRDAWRIIPPSGEGDCEDYSISIIFELAERKWWKFILYILLHKATIYHVKTPNNHAVLRVGDKYIDNRFQIWMDKEDYSTYSFKFPYPGFIVLLQLLIGYLIVIMKNK